MANEPNKPSQQIEQPPTKAENDKKKNAGADKKSEADKYKSPSEGG